MLLPFHTPPSLQFILTVRLICATQGTGGFQGHTGLLWHHPGIVILIQSLGQVPTFGFHGSLDF